MYKHQQKLKYKIEVTFPHLLSSEVAMKIYIWNAKYIGEIERTNKNKVADFDARKTYDLMR